MNRAWFHHSDEQYRWVTDFVSRIIWGSPREMPLVTALAIADGATPIAGVVFTNYDDETQTLEISAASQSKRWLSRPILFEIYSYCFDQMGCQAVIQRNDPADKPLARMLTAYGFNRYDIPRLRGRNKGEAIFVLTDDAWRANGFHKENSDGQEGT